MVLAERMGRIVMLPRGKRAGRLSPIPGRARTHPGTRATAPRSRVVNEITTAVSFPTVSLLRRDRQSAVVIAHGGDVGCLSRSAWSAGDRATGSGANDGTREWCLGVFMKDMVFFGMDFLMLLQVLRSLKCLVANAACMWFQRCVY